eukprot:scaffold144702_cov18-Prasinocladus_malaysianus.AAC.1
MNQVGRMKPTLGRRNLAEGSRSNNRNIVSAILCPIPATISIAHNLLCSESSLVCCVAPPLQAQESKPAATSGFGDDAWGFGDDNAAFGGPTGSVTDNSAPAPAALSADSRQPPAQASDFSA